VLVRLDRKIGEAEAAKLAAAEAEDYQEAARQKRLLGELREQRKSAVTAGPVRRGASTRVSRFAALATRYARPRLPRVTLGRAQVDRIAETEAALKKSREQRSRWDWLRAVTSFSCRPLHFLWMNPNKTERLQKNNSTTRG
jgi:hypothetical protein